MQMYSTIIEEPSIAFSNICFVLGMTESTLAVTLIDPVTHQEICFHLERRKLACNCFEKLVPALITYWKGSIMHLEVVEGIYQNCLELMSTCSRMRKSVTL